MEYKERYVKKFYDSLAEGKFMGQVCKECGTYQVFPVPVCDHCKGTNLEWTALSKDGKVIHVDVSYYPPMRFASYAAPCALGLVQLKEGPVMQIPLEGFDLKNPEKEMARLPLDVDIIIKEVAGNHIPIAKIR